jgi:hypothetical protein
MSRKSKPEAKSITQLSHEVAAILQAPTTDETRFKSMSLCDDIMNAHDQVRDALLRETLRGWVGRVQAKFQEMNG